MVYNGTIRIRGGINTKYLKEMSQTVNDLNRKLGCKTLSNIARNVIKEINPLCMPSYMEAFSSAVRLSQNNIVNCIKNSIDVYENLRCVLYDCMTSIQREIFYISSFPISYKICERSLFLKIADEIGFPIYLEVDSELQDRLIASYRKNANQCNVKVMGEIILDYYNDDYIEHILNEIKSVHVFNSERVILIEEGIETYQLGLYGSSASLFAAQLSGMIRDVYKELSVFHKVSKKEKEELLVAFRQNCKMDSEKSMFLQIIDIQSQGIMLWYKIVWYFLDIIYSSKDHKMFTQPQRHMICHGKQTNYNTKEMNLKLIMCMDIIADLAWRVKNMKEEYLEAFIDV